MNTNNTNKASVNAGILSEGAISALLKDKSIPTGVVLHKGKVMPHYVTKLVEDGRLDLVPLSKVDFDNRRFLRFCLSERELASPVFREFCDKTMLIMNIRLSQTGWECPGFTPGQYRDLVERCRSLVYRRRFQESLGRPFTEGPELLAQYGKPSWLTKGRLYVAEYDVLAELYAKHLRVDASGLSAREKVARLPILFGRVQYFDVAPRVRLMKGEGAGIAFVSAAYAAKEGINEGDKLWPAKASAMIMSMNMESVDLLVPEDNVKFEAHKANPSLAVQGLLPELRAEVRASGPKGRLPKVGFDTLQWLYPQVMDVFPKAFAKRFALAKSVVEGAAPLETMLAMGAYKDAKGETAYPAEFQFLAEGQPKEDGVIRRALFAATGTYLLKALNFPVRGRYGVAVPLRNGEHALNQVLVCPPWMLPMEAKASVSGATMGVQSNWMVDGIGKDYDGDLLMSMDFRRVEKLLGHRFEFLSWNKEADRVFAQQHLSLPEKRKDNDPRSIEDVMVDGVVGYRGIGEATNACMIVLDALRTQGLDRRSLMGLYLTLMSTEVQPYVDSLKYVPGGLKKVNLKELCRQYGARVDLAEKIRPRFLAVRKLHFDALASFTEDSALEGGFYYALSRLFAGWRPYAEVNMKRLGEAYLGAHPAEPVMEAKRRHSYAKYGKDTDARIAMLKEHLDVRLVALAWAHNDKRLALALEKALGKRLIEEKEGLIAETNLALNAR